MVQIDQSSPQQWSEYFTAAHMGLPPPTRWSIQRANGQYRDHLVGQLTTDMNYFYRNSSLDDNCDVQAAQQNLNFIYIILILLLYHHNIIIFLSLGGSTSGPRTIAESGSNISIACSGITESSLVYLVEWVCSVRFNHNMMMIMM